MFLAVAGCSSADRGGCSQLCTPVTRSGWQCGCLPGYQLHQDGKRCIATGESQYGTAKTDNPTQINTPYLSKSHCPYYASTKAFYKLQSEMQIKRGSCIATAVH